MPDRPHGCYGCYGSFGRYGRNRTDGVGGDWSYRFDRSNGTQWWSDRSVGGNRSDGAQWRSDRTDGYPWSNWPNGSIRRRCDWADGTIWKRRILEILWLRIQRWRRGDQRLLGRYRLRGLDTASAKHRVSGSGPDKLAKYCGSIAEHFASRSHDDSPTCH